MHPGFQARHPCSGIGCVVCRLYGTPAEHAKTIPMPQKGSSQGSLSSSGILGLTPVSNQPIFFQCCPLDLTVSRHLVSYQPAAEDQPLDLSTGSLGNCRDSFNSEVQSPGKYSSLASQHMYPGQCLDTSLIQENTRCAKFASNERYLMEGGYIFLSDPDAFNELASEPVFPRWKLDVTVHGTTSFKMSRLCVFRGVSLIDATFPTSCHDYTPVLHFVILHSPSRVFLFFS